MRKKTLIMMVVVFSLLFGTATVSAGPEFFITLGSNTEKGGQLGTNHSGNPKDWDALHSQYNGSIVTYPRIGNALNSNMTFLWTREEGDNQAYKMKTSFDINRDTAVPVVLEVGFDQVYSHTQVAWPGGYWVSNDVYWQNPLDASPNAAGSYTLNSDEKSVIVPANVNKLYIRIRVADTGAGGFTHITNGSISFTAVDYSDEDEASSLPERNVVTEGADPTGVVDSTSIIQAAMDQGGSIYFPSGIYKISKTLVITKPYTELRGGRGSIIKVAANTPVTAISNTLSKGVWNLHNIVIRDLTILNDLSNSVPGDNLQFTQGISFQGVRDSHIENVVVKNFQHDNIYIGYSKNIVVESVQTVGARHGITVNGHFDGGRYGVWNVQISNAHTTDTFDTGIVIGFFSHYVSVSNSIIENSWAHGIDIFNSSHIVIDGNTIKNWNVPHGPNNAQIGQSVGVFVHPDWGISTFIPTEDVVITGNTVIYDKQLPVGITPIGIEVTGNVDTASITGNQIIGAYRGFYLREQPYDIFYTNRPDQRVDENASMAPRNVVFSSNVIRGQKSSVLKVESAIVMPALIANNIFTSSSTGAVEINVPLSSKVALQGNSFYGGGLDEMNLPTGVNWNNNLIYAPLTLELTAARTTIVNQLLSFTATAIGEAGRTLTYSATGLPQGASLDSATGVFTWTPTEGDQGQIYPVIFFVSDGTNTVSKTVTITVNSDIAPVDATIAASITEPTNNDVIVTISYPTDAATKEYKVGTSGAWTAYTGPIAISTNDTVYTRGTSALGSMSNITNLVVSNIDKIAPVSIASVGPDATMGSNGKYISDVTITIAASDELSGIVRTEYRINNGPWAIYTGSIPAYGDGIYTFEYRSVDHAGNVETIKSMDFEVSNNRQSTEPSTGPITTSTVIVEPTSTPKSTGEPIKVKSEVTFDKTTHIATSTINAADWAKAQLEVKSDSTGKTTIRIEVDAVPGAKEYVQILPSEAISSNNKSASIEVVTSLASMIIPSNMFQELPSGDVGIHISRVDSNTLDDKTKKQVGEYPVFELNIQAGGKTIPWNNPNAPVTVSVPYTPTAKELKNPEHIVIWYIDGEGEIHAVPNGKYDPLTGHVKFSTTHFSKYAISYVEKTFNDIVTVNWAKKQIELLASKGIVNGASDSEFIPFQAVTRADFLVLLVRTLELQGALGDPFADVSEDSYYSEALRIARSLGVATGGGDNRFEPLAPITREDIMVLTDRALKAVGKQRATDSSGDVLGGFNDTADISGYAKGSVSALIQMGLIQGTGQAVRPKETANRAQTAVLMYNLYQYIK
ncbi:S-layer homology domain-containing protein [Cohnella abietis]|uniref:SLH domain-containing protein n=1 Tax=Cohnella abietis TaxID=2507935 RepID=A0A3T1D1S5_9BACL|nr:S-layer homology domain-containing protein [Cohnella abietis]BBI31969.1 hypothetical protein KCTCHS21_13680 [Cohnella abietis]